MAISQEERERAVARSRRMYQSDLESNLITAEDRGRAAGRLEGILEARREGKLEVKMETARVMLSDGEPIEKIMRYTGLTQKEIAQI